MENSQNPTPVAKKTNWLVWVLLVLLVAAIGVIIYLFQSGQLFKGTTVGVIGDAVSGIAKTSIEDTTNGPFFHVSSTHGDSCDTDSVLGTPSCPFSTLDEAEEVITEKGISTAEIRLAFGGAYADYDGTSLSGGRKSIIGGYNEDFTAITNNLSWIYSPIYIEGANGNIKNLYYYQTGQANKPMIEIDNTGVGGGTNFNVDNIITFGVTFESLIKYTTDNSDASATFENLKIYNSLAEDGAIIDIVGNGDVTIQRNHINNSAGADAIIHIDENAKVLNNLISNTPGWNEIGLYTPHAVLINDGADSMLINNTIVDNVFFGFAVKQTGEGLIGIFNNLIDDNNTNNIFDIFNLNFETAQGNTWGIVSTGSGQVPPVYGINENYNFSCNPKFVEGDDNTDPTYYTLGLGSDCIDEGHTVSLITNMVSPDFFGVDRPVNNDIDPGFNEYSITFTPMGLIPVDYIPLFAGVCGDGTLDTGEVCDDGNTVNGDGCSSFCLVEVAIGPICGNGNVESGEECDDGNNTNGDGCSATCQTEQPLTPECGNGAVEGTEECDDGNTSAGDGCSAICTVEQPAGPECGNFILEGGESCDDGNILNGDGCDSNCAIEGGPDPDLDLCPNINGLQTEIPGGFYRISGECLPITSSYSGPLNGDDDDDDDEGAACGEWSDVSDNDPEYDIWVYLCDREIFKGNPDGTLRIEELLTRAELLALAFRASDYENEYDLDEDASYCFNDVDDQWFASYACSALDYGFVEGYVGNLFKPANNVILAEGLKMFLGALDEPFVINPDPNRWYFDMLQDAADDNYLPYTLTDERVVGPIELTRRKAANMLYRMMIYR
ncbi:DUF4215 domain-containing protein [Patescibacteria group bacterium]